jgi:hypothetical protein
LDIRKLQLPIEEITIETLNKEIAANDQLLAKLNKLANNIGLHWYNKVYRKLRHAIVDPPKQQLFRHYVLLQQVQQHSLFGFIQIQKILNGSETMSAGLRYLLILQF